MVSFLKRIKALKHSKAPREIPYEDETTPIYCC